MITLIIDTSTDKSFVAIADGAAVLFKFFLPQGAQCSRFLMPTIETAFKELKLEASTLKTIAVALGPGSYTGIRVGLAAAKGLAFSRSVPLIGFCSLESFISQEDGKFASLIDARIGGYYVLQQERKADHIIVHSKPELIAKENLNTYLIDYQTHVGPHLCDPNIAYLAQLIAKKIDNQEYAFDLDPLYLRTPNYQCS